MMNAERIMDEEMMLTDFEILSAVRDTLHPLSPGSSGGSHTEVKAFDPAALADVLADLADRNGAPIEPARNLGRRIAKRFLVKIGNVTRYVIKLKGGRESVIRRPIPSEAFGPSGYNMAPTLDKVLLDAREAVREIPYLACGDVADQFAPDVLQGIRNNVSGRERSSRPDGTFLVIEGQQGRERRNAYSILGDDPYFPHETPDFGALTRFQSFVREHPLDVPMSERLGTFFDASMTVGARDVLRWMEGSRHPDLGWKAAEGVIKSCFATHGHENFLPPEINYYTRSVALDAAESRRIDAVNRLASNAFARWMVERLPFVWTTAVADAELNDAAAGILDLHFDYPLFEVEPYSGLLSTTSMRLALRVAVGATLHLTGIEVPERRNPLTPVLAERSRAAAVFLGRLTEEQRSEACNEINGMLWEVAVRGGIPAPDGSVLPYQRQDRTFYSFQEKAQHALDGRAQVEEVLTLEEMVSPLGEDILRRHPDLARQLTVFFTLAYRYFLDTGHVPDLRPDDAGMDLFVRGIWGYKTRNVLVVTGHAPDGRPVSAVRFVDNKDQFKQYRRWEDRQRRMVSPVVQPAMERSLGMYVARVAATNGVKGNGVPDVPEALARATREVLRSGVKSVLSHSEAFLNDLIDDTADGVERTLHQWPWRRS
jgi:hypothetical protein